jgi:hypothetical protein
MVKRGIVVNEYEEVIKSPDESSNEHGQQPLINQMTAPAK